MIKMDLLSMSYYDKNLKIIIDNCLYEFNNIRSLGKNSIEHFVPILILEYMWHVTITGANTISITGCF